MSYKNKPVDKYLDTQNNGFVWAFIRLSAISIYSPHTELCFLYRQFDTLVFVRRESFVILFFPRKFRTFIFFLS